jgi:putative thioredoxin
MTESSHIIPVSADNFAVEVLEQSNRVPVLIDFWAEWCGPCKTLMPIVEKLAVEYQGQFILAKINIDEQPALANQFSVRSVPTLKLIRHGTVVDEALGVQSEAALRAMIDAQRDRPADELRRQAAQAHRAGDSAQAVSLLRTACEMEPEYYASYLDLAQVLLESGQLTEAEQLLRGLPANIQTETATKQLMAYLTFSLIAAEAPHTSLLNEQLAADPTDLRVRHQLAALLVLQEDYEAALAHLLELMRQSRQYGEDAGRRGIVDVFLLLNDTGPLVTQYRSKMASLLY